MGGGNRARRLAQAVAAAALVTAAVAAPVLAAPTTTLQRTIQDRDGDNLLDYAPGEDYQVLENAAFNRRLARPILNFLQQTDFQIIDEESPARVEFLDTTQRFPGFQPFSAAYRPEESLTNQITEAMVRQARNTVSPITAKPLDLTILTGDNADNQQYNETRWFIDIMDGTDTGANPDPEMENPPDRNRDRKIDPDTGIPGPCDLPPGTDAQHRNAGSQYDGVKGGGKFGYYDPDASAAQQDGDGYSPREAENASETGRSDIIVRDFPNLFEVAQDRFEALGIDMPWYSAFGNHDALIQGNSPDAYFGPGGASDLTGRKETFNPQFQNVAVGCLKPSKLPEGLQDEFEALPDEPSKDEAKTFTEHVQSFFTNFITNPSTVISQTEPVIVPPDPRRCFVAKDNTAATDPTTPAPCNTGGWIQQHFRTSGTPVGHGFAPSPALSEFSDYGKQFCQDNPTDARCQAAYGRPPEAQQHHDGYYSFSPARGLRFVVLDTITDECGTEFCSEGSVDDDQFKWLRGQINTAAGMDQYVIVFSHHTLRTTRQPTTDPTEVTPVGQDPPPGPIHYGERRDRRGNQPQNPGGGETLEELYCKAPARNVVAHVNGHEHENYTLHHRCSGDPPPNAGGTGDFWEISTASHVDWPEQSRMIEALSEGGQLFLALTMLDHDGPAYPGGAPQCRDPQHSADPDCALARGAAGDQVLRLASIGRELAYNDYQTSRGARGASPSDRNVIVPLRRPWPYPDSGNP